jgi:hypothetical protein
MVEAPVAFLVIMYWMTTIVWTALTVMFGMRYLKSKSGTMLALTIACLSQSFSTTYFGIMITAEYYLLPNALYAMLSAPYMWMIPKIGLVFGALAIYAVIWKGGK